MESMGVITSLGHLLLDPLKAVMKHILYPFVVSSNINSLESTTRELRAKKEDVKTTIMNARQENGVPTQQIKLWLDEVEVIEHKAREIQQNYQQLSRGIWNISPNLWSKYNTSRSAAMKQQEAEALFNKRANINVIVQMQMPPHMRQENRASTSKAFTLELVIYHIKDDVHNKIGIWDMSGVGKTHLLKQVNNEISKDDVFDVVIFVTCSKDCSEEKVQNEIIDKLGLHKNDNVKQKQSTVYNFLCQRSFLLLLDDLWDRVDFETIGIPNLSSKRKVVLTTQSIEVCGQMEAHKKIKVEFLNEVDAWFVFKENATEETINSDPFIQKCAVEVAEHLGRLPIALITVGRAMHDKIDPREWECALLLLKQAQICDVESSDVIMSVFRTLKFSYDSLKNDTLKQCFLHCSLWPEDWRIKKEDLIEVWMGLGLIDEPEIHTAYNIGYNYISKLQDVCLLEEIDDGGSIKMHEVIRDMALWIASDQGVQKSKWISKAGRYHECQVIEVSHETEKMSIRQVIKKRTFYAPFSTNKISTMLLCDIGLKDIKALRLETFCELKVLDLSHNGFSIFPIEICKLVQLQFLNYSDNSLTESLPKELEALINLKYLLLRSVGCTIPEGVLSKLKALRVLDLRCSYLDWENFAPLEEELRCLPQFQALGFIISSVHDFQKLSQMLSVPIRWLQIDNLNAQECLSFTSSFFGNSQLQNNLIYLYIESTKWVKFERASDDQIICCLGRLEQLDIAYMNDLKEVIWKGINPKDVFPRLQVVRFEFCCQLTSISWVVCLPCIRELHLQNCLVMKQLIHIDELNNEGIMISQYSFPFLKKLFLAGNFKLESISDSMITFPVLEYLNVYLCNKLKKLPFKMDNPPKVLQLEGSEVWWNNIEMENSSYKSLLLPFFTKNEYKDEYEDEDEDEDEAWDGDEIGDNDEDECKGAEVDNNKDEGEDKDNSITRNYRNFLLY